MKLKRLVACLLVTATLCTLSLPLPASAAQAAVSGFADITDPEVGRAAELLRLLHIVDGTGDGYFNPSRTLTRGEFCKMAVLAMDKGSEAAAQANRTIFNDVKGNHWARGYINLAASTPIGASSGEAGSPGGDMLMMGIGNSSFGPEQIISYSQAVTIMMRILGYGSKDVASGAAWYDGYLATAGVIGLTDGVSLPVDSPITRGQTALLFENMFFISPNGGKDPYLTTLQGRILDESILLSLDATTDDGVTGAVQVTDGTAVTTYKTDHVPFDSSLAGRRAKLVLDKDDKVIAIQPSTSGTQRTVSVVSAEATYFTVSGGEKITLATDTPVYKDGVKKAYKDLYLGLKAGVQLSLHFAATGKLEYIYVPSVDAAVEAAVARAGASGNPFSSLVGGDSGYRVVKNGVSATLSDVRTYDVATYDKATRTLSVSDLRLTGVYENVSPSPATPLSVTLMGAEFPVLSSAYSDLSNFHIGDTVTLLLTGDGQVAGAVPPSAASSTTVGTVAIKNGVAVVTPLMNIRNTSGEKITFTGLTNLSDYAAAGMQGQLVTVSSSKVNYIDFARLAVSGAPGALDVGARTMGGVALADNVTLYERVGTGMPARISMEQLTRATVPASAISYVGTDYAGRINVVVFDDATGDQYTYGIARLSNDGQEVSNPTVAVEYASGLQSDPLITRDSIKPGSLIGIAASQDQVGKNTVFGLAGWVSLKAVKNVSRTAFDLNEDTSRAEGDLSPIGTVSANGMVLPVAGNVVCYNQNTKKWFRSLDEARAYSDTITIYYDRAPQEGGKVRMVVVE